MSSQEIKIQEPNGEEGMVLLEVLAAVLLLSVISLSVAINSLNAMRTAKFTEHNHAASSLAISKMEELASIDVSNLTAANSSTESSVTFGSLNTQFSRVATVTVNADNSRSITVEVSTVDAPIPTTVSFTTSFAEWE